MSKPASDTSADASTAGEAAHTLASTPSSQRSTVPISTLRGIPGDGKMDDSSKDGKPADEERQENTEAATSKPEGESREASKEDDTKSALAKKKEKAKCKKPQHQKKKSTKSPGGKKDSKKDSAVESTSEEDLDDGDSSDSSSSEDEKAKKKRKARKAKKAKQLKKSKARLKKSKKAAASSDSSDSDSDSSDSSDDSEADIKAKLKLAKKLKAAKKLAKVKAPVEESGDEEVLEDVDPPILSQADVSSCLETLKMQIKALRLQSTPTAAPAKVPTLSKGRRTLFGLGELGSPTDRKSKLPKAAKAAEVEEGGPKHYKRVDEIWDKTTYNYKLKPSAEDDDSEFADYSFLVRRTFNWENKYLYTIIDIKSKNLRAALTEIMKDCKSVSLEAKEPHIDPNVLFLYLDELREYYKSTLKSKIKKEKKRKATKKLERQRSEVKALVAYIDEDYAETKKTLYPLLKAGNITFELLWALFKPNEIAVTSCYGQWDEPRCFKIDYANKYSTMMRGEWWCIEGTYTEYDGKAFGHGEFEVDIDSFKGPRKISSLATYPLKYHRDPDAVKKQILERGEKFVSLAGMHYKFHKGLAFMKKKKQVLKININGRMMIDPATFRRINPNYPVSFMKAKSDEELFSLSDDEDDDDCSCCGSDGGETREERMEKKFDEDRPKYKYKWTEIDEGDTMFVAVEVDGDGDPIRRQRVDQLEGDASSKTRAFTEEDLLLTSPVILGFAFSEKLWLEFTISGIHDITWNENAFESLVLPPNQKSIVRALVESHKFSAHRTIDDVVQGKGKGMVSVLHGPPGTGKTLTAEGISELLKCPLYMVSAGELGTEPERLEHELQKILDIAHSWGAILLLDEADVFLEKREVHDIRRNALVSIFLRLLEYFQGILFLTTNRVETFDDAFQSRIHVALRYGELTHKAKKSVWTMFLTMVRKEMEVADFSDTDIEILARHQLNGRQIKNLVRSAQALALFEKKAMGVAHVKRVVDVAQTFDRDLRGGTGYIDAMRSYT